MTPQQLRAIGLAARRLLEHAWSRDPRDPQLVNHALQCVARTYESDPEASGRLLRRAFEPAHLAQYGYQEGHVLATEMKRLVAIDPSFVRDGYAAVFGFEESSEAVSPLGNSRILPMSSTRRQDFEGAKYILAHEFPQFLVSAPVQATSALVASVQGYVAQRHAHRLERYAGGSFNFLGQTAQLIPDGSFSWDAGSTYHKDSAVEMLASLEAHVGDEEAESLATILTTLASENQSAVVWRRLLAAGTRRPTVLGLQIRELAWATPVLKSLDTSTHAGTFAAAMFPLIGIEDRARIERAVLSLPNDETGEERRWAEDRRDSLLGCLPPDLLSTPEARQRIEELVAAGGVPENTPPVQVFSGSWGGPSLEERLERRGIDVHAEANRRILNLLEPLSGLAVTKELLAQGGEPLDNALRHLTELRDALQSADIATIAPDIVRDAWGQLASAAGKIATLELSCLRPAGVTVRNILEAAARIPDPGHDPRDNAKFDETPSYGMTARIQGAEGIMLLARFEDCATADLLRLVEELGRDSDPAVRLQVACNLWLLHKTAPDLMWSIAGRMVAEDASSAVLRFLVQPSLAKLATIDAERSIGLIRQIFDRFASGPGVNELHACCLDQLVGWYVWRDAPGAREAILRLTAARPISVEAATHICADLRSPLVANKGPNDPSGDAVRARALGIFKGCLTPAFEELNELLRRNDGRSADDWPAEDRDRCREFLMFANHAGQELYFASGVFKGGQGDKEQVTDAQRDRLFREAWETIGLLADVGIAPLAHHLLEMLEANIPADPRATFLMIGRVLISGKKGGYQYEGMAESLFVRLVERYLAEHRLLLQSDTECQKTLLSVLDIFAGAGWPSAQRLSYRLDEIFR